MRLVKWWCGNRSLIVVRWCSSIIKMISALLSCSSVTGCSLYNPAKSVVNWLLNSSAAVLLLCFPWLQMKSTCIRYVLVKKHINPSFMVLFGCFVVMSACTVAVPQERGSVQVVFCPQEDCYGTVVDLVRQASDVQCALYRVSGPLVELLEEKHALVVMDGQAKIFPYGAVRRRDRGLMHNKFCVLDHQVVLTGSFNMLLNNPNRDNLVIIDSVSVAKNYESEFAELAAREFGGGDAVEYPQVVLAGSLVQNYFCPDDQCEEQVLRLLQSAQSSIKFLTYSFTSDAVGDLLVVKFNGGVAVEGVMDGSQLGKWSEFEKLQAAGIPITVDDQKGDVHHKVFIVDDQVVWTGSYNPTQNGDEQNDENVVVIYDPEVVARFSEEFARLQQGFEVLQE